MYHTVQCCKVPTKLLVVRTILSTHNISNRDLAQLLSACTLCNIGDSIAVCNIARKNAIDYLQVGDEGFEWEMTQQQSLESFLATCSFTTLIDEKRPRQFLFFINCEQLILIDLKFKCRRHV